MLAALLFVVQEKSLFQRVFAAPSGRNGYEEYVQAADVALTGGLRALVDAVDAPDSRGTRLERQRAVAALCSRIAPLLERGNAKPAFHPGPLSMDTLLPEVGYMRDFGRAFVHKATVEFADGRSVEGFRTLLLALTFGEKLTLIGPMIYHLIGRIVTLPIMRALNEHQALLSLPAAWQLQAAADAQDKDANAWALGIKSELENFMPEVLRLLDEPKRIQMFGTDESIAADLSALSKAQLDSVRKELEFSLRQTYMNLDSVKNLPEREWIPTIRRMNDQARPADSIAARIFSQVTVDTSFPAMYEIVRRTHWRLLRIIAAVTEYRWENGHYPGSLSLLDDASLAKDPLTGGEFFYQRAPGGVLLYSEGTEDTGRIGLDWSAPART